MIQNNVDQSAIDSFKQELLRDGIEKIVVGAIVVDDGKVLLLRRKATDFMGGLVELPSGTVDPNEEILDALVREIKEETSLAVTVIDAYTGCFDYASGSGKKTRQLNFRVLTTGSVQVNPDEHDAYFWVDPNGQDFNTLNISPETKKSIKDALP